MLWESPCQFHGAQLSGSDADNAFKLCEKCDELMRSLKDVFGFGSGKTVYRSACKKLHRPCRAVLAPRRDNFKATAYTSTCFTRFTEMYDVLIEALRLLIAQHVVQGHQVAKEQYEIRTLGDRTYASPGGLLGFQRMGHWRDKSDQQGRHHYYQNDVKDIMQFMMHLMFAIGTPALRI